VCLKIENLIILGLISVVFSRCHLGAFSAVFEQRALQASRPFKLGAFSLFFQGYEKEDPSNILVSAIYEPIEK